MNEKYSDEFNSVSFLIKDDELLKKLNKILDKVNNSVKKRFYSKPVQSKKYNKLKKILMKAKLIQIFMIMKYLKRVFTVSFYQ